jgi:hypothetical protein
MSVDKFKFRRHSSVGAAAAEEDERFLTECFLDTGDLSTLRDCRDAERIVLGRTGTGKTALLNQLTKLTDGVVINPESLSFNYLTNSTILQFFLEAGVKLDLFFKLLWRHVFTLELIKKRYNITNETAKKSFLTNIQSIFIRDKRKERAVNYLLQWGDKFWEPTEYRLKEITSQMENKLKGAVSGKIASVRLGASAATQLSQEEKIEVVQRGQSVINDIQMKELADVMTFLDEDVFDDEEVHHYIIIDKLDENWVEEKFRYLLIRSLIETVRDFQKVRNVKIIVALRNDLIERVFRLTRDPGFQEEKYRSLFLQLKWNETQLEDLLDRRIDFMVRQTYTKQKVTSRDLLTFSVGTESSLSYMIHRTLMRPRELIEFFNDCIEQAENRTTITRDMLVAAEGKYSKDRLRSLQDEWISDYPSLIDFTMLLKKRNRQFRLSEIDRGEIENFCLDYSVQNQGKTDSMSQQALNVAEGMLPPSGFTAFLFGVFYKTGLVGLKTDSFEKTQWSYIGVSTLASDTINGDTRVDIHPTFWRVLGTKL